MNREDIKTKLILKVELIFGESTAVNQLSFTIFLYSTVAKPNKVSRTSHDQIIVVFLEHDFFMPLDFPALNYNLSKYMPDTSSPC